jgi:hypothetical protein
MQRPNGLPPRPNRAGSEAGACSPVSHHTDIMRNADANMELIDAVY